VIFPYTIVFLFDIGYAVIEFSGWEVNAEERTHSPQPTLINLNPQAVSGKIHPDERPTP
jgi:hypothetical protein